jgi:hypothetical protein
MWTAFINNHQPGVSRRHMRIPRRVQIWAILLLGAYTAFQGALYVWADGRRGRFHVESPYFIFITLCLLVSLPALRGFRASETAGRLQPLITFAWCILLAFTAYWPTLSIGLLSDDFVLLDDARQDTGSSYGGEFRRPLAVWLFNLVALAGPPTFHALLVFLHAANGWLLIRLALAMGFEATVSLLVGVLFLVFPASVEAVTWCSGIQDVLMTTCVLAGVLTWRQPWALSIRLVATVPCVLLALAIKETGVVLPVLSLVIWSGILPLRQCLVLAPTTTVVALYVAWRLLAGGVPGDFATSPSQYLVKELLARSFGSSAMPYHYDLGPIRIALRLVTALSMPFLVGYAAVSARSRPDLAIRAMKSALWVLIPALPVYVYFFVAPDLQGSRYLYLGSAGWAVLLVTLLYLSIVPAFGIRRLLALGYGCAFAWLLVVRLHIWPWIEAANLRDEIRRSVVVVSARYDCGEGSTFLDLPDSVRGAYLFRNGGQEALSGALAGDKACRLVWTPDGFVVQ